MQKKQPADFILIFCVLTLTCIGIVMVFSASIYSSSAIHNDQYLILKKQLIAAVIGIIAMYIITNIDYRLYKRHSKLVLFLSIILLGLVLIPGIGVYLNGARRWIRIGGFSIQPSELAKIGVIIFTAASLSDIKDNIRTFKKGLLPYLTLIAVICGLIALEPDLSTALVIAMIIMGMVFIAGGNMGHLFSLFGAVVVAVICLILFTDFRMGRIDAFLNPEDNVSGTYWQTHQSLLALGSGGIFGQGLGNGKQKMFFLPEPQNDFIFAHIGEELGLIGTMFILCMFLLLIWRGLRIALYAPDTFSSLLSFGIIFMIGIQVIINIAVVTNLIPVTGMPLPFISAGGSSLIIMMVSIGILLNISKHTSLNGR